MKLSPSLAITLASLAGWATLLAARGQFWNARMDAHLEGAIGDAAQHASGMRVEALVPARDEAATVGEATASLVAQRFAGTLHVTLIDDDSADDTSHVARSAVASLAGGASFTVIRARQLAPPWTGKLGALDSGVQRVVAERGAPDYWLFTDADIVHDADNVAALVAKARSEDLAAVSLMVRLRCVSKWERLLVPAFIFFFAKLYPFAWANDPRKKTAAAAGGCFLVSNEAFVRAGGFAAIAGRVIDDCALATEIKRNGGRIFLGLTDGTRSLRRYDTLDDLWAMVKRSAFTQLKHSYPLVALALAAMTLLYVVPPLATLGGLARRKPALAACGGCAWCAMAFAYVPTLRAYRRSSLEAFALPVAAALYCAMTVDSAVAHARKRGAAWKGRSYD